MARKRDSRGEVIKPHIQNCRSCGIKPAKTNRGFCFHCDRMGKKRK
jgi:hypothetical protein